MLRTQTASLVRLGRWRLCLAFACALAFGSVSFAADSVPSKFQSAQSEPSGPPTGRDGAGIRIDDLAVNVNRAKVQIVLPPFYTRAAIYVCNIFTFNGGETSGAISNPDGTTTTVYTAADTKVCAPELQRLTYPRKDTDIRFDGGAGNVYVVSSPGPKPTYGEFPTIRVRALAFGSVPVAATLHLSQPVSDGYLVPLRGSQAQTGTLQNYGENFPGFGPIPQPKVIDGVSIDPQLMLSSTIDGEVDARISDVTVDGRRVDVGPRCKTSRPAHIKVNSPRGFYYYGNGYRSPRGLPDSYNLIDGATTFDGVADVPPFSNCGTGGDDLDPLLTSFISSPANRISGFQAGSPIEFWCSVPIAHCDTEQLASEQRIRRLRNAAMSGAPPQTLRALEATLKPGDVLDSRIKAPRTTKNPK